MIVRTLLALLLLSLSSGCKRSPDVVVENPRETVRAAILAEARNCFLDFAPYCITDPVFVDKAIDSTLESYYDGNMPDRSRALARLTTQARMRYTTSLTDTEESRAQLLRTMLEYYENPTIEVEGHIARADAGYVPTGFSPGLRGSGWRLASASPLLEGRQPQSSYVARQLLRIRGAHPEATEIQVRARAPQGTSTIDTLFTWDPHGDIIWVTRRSENRRTTAPLGPNLAPLMSGQVTLTAGLHSCSGEIAMRDPMCN